MYRRERLNTAVSGISETTMVLAVMCRTAEGDVAKISRSLQATRTQLKYLQ